MHIASQPLALVSRWDQYGAQGRPAAEHGEARLYALPAFPVAAVGAIGEQPRHALPRGAHADDPGPPAAAGQAIRLGLKTGGHNHAVKSIGQSHIAHFAHGDSAMANLVADLDAVAMVELHCDNESA